MNTAYKERPTQRGKVASLPFTVLLDMNARLYAGEGQTTVARWLNQQPAVVRRMRARFGGRPINSENISAWCARDYRHWLRHLEDLGINPVTTVRRRRLGKVAQLPVCLREEVCRRMLDGESGVNICHWLNSLPAVAERMRAFGLEPWISGQNLSEWRKGGYADWLKVRANQKEATS